MGGASRGTVLVWAAAAVLATLAVMRLAGGGDAGGGAPVRIDRAPRAAGSADAPKGLFVHVAGAVRRPGLVRLEAGARVAEAVQRAGGLARRADLAGVNLAAQVEDGQQVVVPVRGGGAAAGAATGPATTAPSAAGPGTAGAPKLSLASATAEQLDQIDGIGPTLAQRILEYRAQNGGFGSVEELREVEGIGEKRFATLRDAVQP